MLRFDEAGRCRIIGIVVEEVFPEIEKVQCIEIPVLLVIGLGEGREEIIEEFQKRYGSKVMLLEARCC